MTDHYLNYDLNYDLNCGARWRWAATILFACLATFCAFPLFAAPQQGVSGAAPVARKGPSTGSEDSATLGPPTEPVADIIQKFAAKESEFKIERDNFTYTQTFVMQTLDDTNRVDGEYRRTSDITFDDRGKRVERDTYAPTPTLERLSLTQEDLNDLENLYPFVLTSQDVSKYDIKYVDHVQLDELSTYEFDVSPKTLEKNQRYFQGRIWVDDKDFQIVKTFGKPVYAKSRATENQAFPRFETFRENIEGKYWFPTYTRANEMLRFKQGDDVHIRLTVRYENYKRFGVTVKIGPAVRAPDAPAEKK
ncbi:MAG TPA: hypothetical protein VGI34_06400 [Candidatus Acidoferrales bacterium]|jgi:hypothetical protein